MSYADIIDKWRPYNGRCLFCGHWDQRHRMIDFIRDRLKAGETYLELQREYRLSFEVLEAMRFCRIDKRRYPQVERAA